MSKGGQSDQCSKRHFAVLSARPIPTIESLAKLIRNHMTTFRFSDNRLQFLSRWKVRGGGLEVKS